MGTLNNGWMSHLKIHDVGLEINKDHCLYVSATTNSLFEDCELYNAIAADFQTQTSSTSFSHANNNTFNRLNVHHNGAHGGRINSGTGNIIKSSQFWLNGSVGLHLQGGGSGTKAYFCTVYKNNQTSTSSKNVQVDSIIQDDGVGFLLSEPASKPVDQLCDSFVPMPVYSFTEDEVVIENANVIEDFSE